MALYFNGEKVKINLDGILYKFNLYFPSITVESTRLLSSDGYILKDSNGLYLVLKEGE